MVLTSIYIGGYIILMISLFGFYAGNYMFILSSNILQEKAKNQVFSRDSPRYPLWYDTSKLHMNMDFYFFNWTNPEELNKVGKKPTFVQVGPYSFLFTIKREEVTFHPKKSKVSYYQQRSWYFDKDRSVGTLQDTITQLDAVAVSAIHRTRYSPQDVHNLFYTLGLKSNFSIIKTIDELLFTGYEDKLNDLELIPAVEKFLPSDRFGWFYMRNGSVDFDGFFNMDTGSKNISYLGILRRWNYSNTTTYYKRPCNIIEGSTGDFWPPNQTKDDIKLFIPDLCRPLTYEFNKRTEYMGIKGNQYTLGQKSLGSITERRDYQYDKTTNFQKKNSIKMDKDLYIINRCYCNGDCSPSGLINITSCHEGSPVFASLPHFYKADPILSNQVVGMKPSKEDHSYHITLEPTTGIVLEFAARLQINMLLPLVHMLPFRDVSRIYFPIFWYSMKFKVPENIISDLQHVHSAAYSYRRIGYIICTGCITSSVIIILGLLYFSADKIRRFLRQHNRDIPMVELNRLDNAQN